MGFVGWMIIKIFAKTDIPFPLLGIRWGPLSESDWSSWAKYWCWFSFHFPSLCVLDVKALANLHFCTCSSQPLLLTYICNKYQNLRSRIFRSSFRWQDDKHREQIKTWKQNNENKIKTWKQIGEQMHMSIQVTCAYLHAHQGLYFSQCIMQIAYNLNSSLQRVTLRLVTDFRCTRQNRYEH